MRESTGNGQEMVDLMVQIMRGEAINGLKPKIRDQMDAASWLVDRGFGRPVTQLESTTRYMNLDLSLTEMTSKELMKILETGRA